MYIIDIVIISILTLIQVYLLYYSILCIIESGIKLRYSCLSAIVVFVITTILSFYGTYHIRKLYIYGSIKPEFFMETVIAGSAVCTVMTLMIYVDDNKRRKKSLRSNSIQFAVDGIEQGICIYNKKDGISLLMNQSMYKLIYSMFNKSIIDGRILWKSLNEVAEDFGIQDTAKDSIYVSTIDKRIYRFTRNSVEDNNNTYYEIISTDVSDIAEVSKKLYEDNIKLNEQFHKTEELVKRKRALERKEEILAQKIQIHRKLGECIISTRNVIRKSSNTSVNELMELWEDTMKGIEAGNSEGDQMNYKENMQELADVAKIMGCEIILEYIGDISMEDLSEEYRDAYTDLIREALCNAVRHGKANKLFVKLKKANSAINVIISDNGNCESESITEGGGLKNLRELLEGMGSYLKISVEEGHAVLESTFYSNNIV